MRHLRIRVWPARSFFRLGWRVQVDDLTNWLDGGDRPQFTASKWPGSAMGYWARTQHAAVLDGVRDAVWLHDTNGAFTLHIGGHAIELDEAETVAGAQSRVSSLLEVLRAGQVTR